MTFIIDEDLQSHFDQYKTLEQLSIPLTRTSKDHRTNTHGLSLIDICKNNNNIFILNGRFPSEKASDILTFRNKSTIDYVIASSKSLSHKCSYH